MSDRPFGPDVVAAVTTHVNDDHPGACLDIVRGLGALDGAAIEARLTDVDAVAATFTASVGGRDVRVWVPWSRRIAERAEIRTEDPAGQTLTMRGSGFSRDANGGVGISALSFPFLVADVVAMGRAPWRGTPRAAEDAAAVAAAIGTTEIRHLADRPVTRLSGGEQARVALARVLAQDTPVVLLDEPTAALDLRHQARVLREARRLADAGRAVVAVLHDLTAAARAADRLVLLDAGRVVAAGPPEAVLDPARLSAVYAHGVAVMDTARGVVVVPDS